MEENKLDHPCFPQPLDENTKVWRYIETSKLIDILSRKCLFLSRIDLLGDPHEGSVTDPIVTAREAMFKKHGKSKVIPAIVDGNKQFLKSVFASCWYYDNHESHAMWKLYCSNDKGVAIQTTYRKLVESVHHDNDLYIGAVKYIDYKKAFFPLDNMFYPIMHKRISFQHENEIRLVKPDSKYWGMNSPTPPPGIYCPWDVEKFAENIYVNPYADAWYCDVVKDVIGKYGYKINIEWSTMKATPNY